MKFSIIVPIYNVGIYLEECIQSVLSQTYNNFELILVNDGSTDESLDICKKYQKLSSRIIIIDKKNGGLVSARKAGAIRADGDYIINLDGDDFWVDNEFLYKLNQFLEKDPKIDMICTGFHEYRLNQMPIYVKNEVSVGVYENDELVRIVGKYLYDYEKRGISNNIIIPSIWSKIVRKDIYRECQLMVDDRITKGEDVYITFLLLVTIKKMLITDLSSYAYRQNENSMMHVFKISDMKNLELLISEMSNNNKLFKEYTNQINVYCMERYFAILVQLAKTSNSLISFLKSSKKIRVKGLEYKIKKLKIEKHNSESLYKVCSLRVNTLIYIKSKIC